MKLTSETLLLLWEVNHFPIPENGLVVFGLRGAVPITPTGKFSESQELALQNVDYVHPSCTIGIYNPEKQVFAVFQGSTVPHQKYIRRAKRGKGTNQMLTGAFDLTKGTHRYGHETAQEALRNDKLLPIQRTIDDYDYDRKDKIYLQRTYNNLHAGYCCSASSDLYESAGCTVICGYPHLPKLYAKTENKFWAKNHGDWAKFHDIIYGTSQRHFEYFLLTAQDALRVSHGNYGIRLRFGSQGEKVKDLQNALSEYEGQNDGILGHRTFLALLKFQKKTFGQSGTDGIVGNMTASALNVSL